MPRDLFASPTASDPPLTSSPLPKTPQSGGGSTATGEDGYDETSGPNGQRSDWRAKANEKNNLHPYVQTLSKSSVDSCLALENSAFPENERCSKEKFLYRLTTCPSFSLGLFSTAPPTHPLSTAPTYTSAQVPDSSTPARKSVLIAHVIATKITSQFVTDESMESRGHHDNGRTIAVHSLAVLPEYQKKGLGKIVMKAYVQRMEGAGVAERISLLAHGDMIKFYEGLGFEDKGESGVVFGGGGWRNMVYEFAEQPR